MICSILTFKWVECGSQYFARWPSLPPESKTDLAKFPPRLPSLQVAFFGEQHCRSDCIWNVKLWGISSSELLLTAVDQFYPKKSKNQCKLLSINPSVQFPNGTFWLLPISNETTQLTPTDGHWCWVPLIVTVLHQDEGGIGKSIPDGQKRVSKESSKKW